MGKKRKSSVASKPWCWYCDREFEDEKVLITHQKAKHFKCIYCYKKLNSASGLVIHVAQIHKETMTTVPNAVEGHDTPELDIFGMSGVPPEDLQRHQEGLPSMPYKRLKVSDGGLLPLLAAQKAGVPDGGKRGSAARAGSGAGMGYMPAAVVPFPGTPFSPPLPTMPTTTTTAGPGATAVPLSPPSVAEAATADASPSSTVTVPSSASGSAPSPPGSASVPLHPPYHHPMMMMMGRGAPPPMPYYMMYGHYHHPPPPGTIPPPPPPPIPPPYYHHPHPAMMGAYAPPPTMMSPPPTMQIPPPEATAAAAEEHGSRSGEAPPANHPVEPPPAEGEEQDWLSLVYPPSVDPNTGRMLPGGIIVAPHVHKSMEELRASMKQYRCPIAPSGR